MDEAETLLDPVNPYDCSKISFDALARCFATAVTGLRLGTVCGMSPHLRSELIFNAMNISALRERCVRVANRASHRNILFLDDLAHYVLRLLTAPQALPPILNTGSLNIAIGELASAVASFHQVPLVGLPDGKTYSFRMSCGRIQARCGAPAAQSLAERCAAFTAAFLASDAGALMRKAS
jgi:nucleoside-diphosphate-sugar epimerase